MTNLQRFALIRWLLGGTLLFIAWAVMQVQWSYGQTCFALQPGEDAVLTTGSSRRITESELRLPLVKGVTIRNRVHWGDRGLKMVAECTSLAKRTGDLYTLLNMGGATSQPWTEANLNVYIRLADRMGAIYARDPACWGVHVTGCSPSGVSEELHWPNPMSQQVLAANKRLIDAYAVHFPRQKLLLAISAKDQSGRMEELIRYGQSRAPGRFLVKHNSLKANPFSLSTRHHMLVANAGKLGALIGFEMVGSASKDASRFGSSDVMAGVNRGRQIAATVPAGIPYMAIYKPDLKGLR